MLCRIIHYFSFDEVRQCVCLNQDTFGTARTGRVASPAWQESKSSPLALRTSCLPSATMSCCTTCLMLLAAAAFPFPFPLPSNASPTGCCLPLCLECWTISLSSLSSLDELENKSAKRTGVAGSDEATFKGWGGGCWVEGDVEGSV